MSFEYEWKEPRPSRAKKVIPRSSHGHFVTQMVINDAAGDPGQISRCGSIAEYRTRLIALAEQDTVDVVEQVGPFYWVDDKNKRHEHYLDQVIHKADGRKFGITDKPYRRVSEKFGDEIIQVCKDGQARAEFDELFVVTEYGRDPIKLFNADLMRGCRDADLVADSEAQIVVDEHSGVILLSSLVEAMAMGPRGFRALVRLIASGGLEVCEDEKISHGCRVIPKGIHND